MIGDYFRLKVVESSMGRGFETFGFKSCDKKKIVVVGPQRSGTRFAAWALARDLGYEFVDQKGIGISGWGRLKGQLDKHVKVVIQGTGCTHNIHNLNRDDTLIVWVRRREEEILASEKRINWSCQKPELGRIPEKYRGIRPSCRARLAYWKEEQRDRVPHWTEVRYDFLKTHHLYMPKKERDSLRGGKGMDWNSCGEDAKKGTAGCGSMPKPQSEPKQTQATSKDLQMAFRASLEALGESPPTSSTFRD